MIDYTMPPYSYRNIESPALIREIYTDRNTVNRRSKISFDEVKMLNSILQALLLHVVDILVPWEYTDKYLEFVHRLIPIGIVDELIYLGVDGELYERHKSTIDEIDNVYYNSDLETAVNNAYYLVEHDRDILKGIAYRGGIKLVIFDLSVNTVNVGYDWERDVIEIISAAINTKDVPFQRKYYIDSDKLPIIHLRKLAICNYKEYLATPHWQLKRKQALKNAMNRCQICASRYGLETHHITYEHLGCERPYDLTVLCNKCHNRFHKNQKLNGGTLKQQIEQLKIKYNIRCD